jgi:hypothetical protein
MDQEIMSIVMKGNLDHSDMQPAVVFPLHDPQGEIFPHLSVIRSSLKSIFSHAYVGVTAGTCEQSQEQVKTLEEENFFTLFRILPGSPIGDQWLTLYRQAASAAYPGQILHLCFIDRLAFILQSSHREQFVEDVSAIEKEDAPLIFSRSSSAWESHPRNYFEIEKFATTVGELLFGRQLDFTWCHLAICASQLEEVASQVKHHDMSMQAEMVLAIQDSVTMQEVDWLEWEDPFLLNCSGNDLKSERERSAKETEKRLSYIIPTIQTLVSYSN